MRAFNIDLMRENGRDRDDKFDLLSFSTSFTQYDCYNANLNLLMFSGLSLLLNLFPLDK